jgi:starch phosphorylase
MTKKIPKVAYFSMEFALKPEIPNFAGGLGVLATDIMRSAADLEMDVTGISLIYHQNDDPKKAFNPGRFFEKMPQTVTVEIEGRPVKIGVWKHEIEGITGHKVAIYFLDSFFPENERWDRDLTKELYDTNQYTRLCQELILGVGGVRMIRELGLEIDVFHMNEGHASFLTFERLREEENNLDAVRENLVFTTHTPIPAGHDRFPHKLVRQVAGDLVPKNVPGLTPKEDTHTTRLALRCSRACNGVSKKHAEVCQKMFPGYHFLAITNGVHHRSWIGEGMAGLFDKHLKGWRETPETLKNALNIPDADLKEAHLKNKRKLIDFLHKHPEDLVHLEHGGLEEHDYFDEETLTITFSRRFVPYKRPLLFFRDLDRLREIGYEKIQVIYDGICHPDDKFCNSVMKELKHLQKELRGQIRLAVLPNRNLDSAALLVAGSDVWLNNPEPPMEACGTSGMKAAMNGGLNFSTLDGWWIEAAEMEPLAGWACGCDIAGHDEFDCDEIYSALSVIIDTYYKHPEKWLERMKRAIMLGAYFNTHRTIREYLDKMWQ